MSSSSIVAIYAHPDDGDFFAAGSLAKWSAEGRRVFTICCSDGATAARQRGRSATEVAAARAEELRRAARELGGEEPILLGFPDGFLDDQKKELRERLVFWLRQLRPERVVTFDPFVPYEIHPDHTTVGRMASEAAVFACFPLVYPAHLEEGLEPHLPGEVWYMGPTAHRPNRVIDIAGHLERKIRAVLVQSTQRELLADWLLPGADPRALGEEEQAAVAAGTRRLLETTARSVGSASGKVELGEAFYALRCGPGHFQNYEQLLSEPFGAPPAPIQVG